MYILNIVGILVTSFFTFSSSASAEFNTTYVTEMNSLSSGANTQTMNLGLLTFNIDKALSDSVTFYTSAIGTHGTNPSDFLGDIGGVSNIATSHNTVKLYELWFEKQFDRLSLLIGLHDLNSEFYVNRPSLLFLNSSLGIGAEFALTGVNGPSIFPATAYAIRANYAFQQDYYLRIGLYNAIAGDFEQPYGTHTHFDLDKGILSVVEVGKESSLTKTSLGVWRYSHKHAHVLEEEKINDWGVYLLLDHQFEKLSGFVRLGSSTPEVNSVDLNVSAGVTIPMNYGDEALLGFAVSLIEGNHKYLESRGISGAHEITYELTYQFRYGKHLILQPNIQCVTHPGLDSTAKSALAFTQRLIIEI